MKLNPNYVKSAKRKETFQRHGHTRITGGSHTGFYGKKPELPPAQVCSAARPITAGIGSSAPRPPAATQIGLSGCRKWMDAGASCSKDACVLSNGQQGASFRDQVTLKRCLKLGYVWK